ncbi:karyopherin Kap95 [Fimicolochytrium jonesii]|uniref:karyopherin Kap95 n=1 Tax=Fimicolochytrium jonesii TaxID=1396493 RepID=UPI0022FE0675|nr:karyopherin Kap95 [Fimicolochytrium jonesii]KAI8826727.1 karyopherin Kap95 [Fimicolochytrium jonesii]
MSLTEILEATLNVGAEREKAEAHLNGLADQDFPRFLSLMCTEFANEQTKEHVRLAAALLIKNAISAKDPLKKEQLASRWLASDPGMRTAVKGAALNVLNSPAKSASNGATQVIQAIAEVELPQNQWPDLMPIMLDNVTNPAKAANTDLKKATLKAIGLVCEAVDPNVLTQYANPILTAVCSGATPQADPALRETALNALLNALEFVKSNFEHAGERNFIMQVVCEACKTEPEEVQVAGFECLVKIMSLYYEHMEQYMQQALSQLTLWGMTSETEEIALQAVEFWSTVCEVEIDIEEENAYEDDDTERPNFRFATVFVKELVDALWFLMTKKEEDDDEDDWNVSMAAATCLSLLAQATHDAVIEPILKYIQQHITGADWRHREAAVTAFGSVLEGPSPEGLTSVVAQALRVLIPLMKDEKDQVKDSTAWTLGRICELHPEAIGPEFIQPVISVLLEGLREKPRIASNCAWSLMNFGESIRGNGEPTYVLSSFFPTIIEATSSAADSSTDPNFKASCYEAQSSLVRNCAQDCLPTVKTLSELILDRLQQTIQMQNQLLTQDDRQNHYELQSNLCGILGACIRRLGAGVIPLADQAMQALLVVMTSASRSSTVMEDTFLAISSLTGALESHFLRYMDAFAPQLFAALQNVEEPQMCSIAVGVVGDLTRALGEQFLPYCEPIMNLLMAGLQNANLDKSVKPSILSTFGDIALAIGAHFEAYLYLTMAILQQAGAMADTAIKYDLDYGSKLRESIIEAYVGITQGLKTAGKPQLLADARAAPHIFAFAQAVAESERTVEVTSGLVGLIGDLADTFPPGPFRPMFAAEWIQSFLRSVKTDQSLDLDTRRTAKWARDAVRRQIQ